MLPPFWVESNMAAIGHRKLSYLRNFLADCHYFGVYYKVSRVLIPSEMYLTTINNVLTKLLQYLITN